MAKRFENKHTHITGTLVELNDNGTFSKKEISAYLEYYLRAENKLDEELRKANGLDANAILQDVKAKHIDLKPKEFAIGRMIHDGIEFSMNEPVIDDDDNLVIIPATLYRYKANVYSVEIASGEPLAHIYETELTHQKFSKGNAKSFIIGKFETDYITEKVVFIERNPKCQLRYEENVWFVVDAATAENYER